MDSKVYNRKRIQRRIRKKIQGTPVKPRLAISRSNKGIACQLIDDINSVTIASASSNEVSGYAGRVEQAKMVGALIGSKAKDAGVSDVKFDRGGYLYHGRVKSLADAAREAGLNF